jgi:hypothetical protein
VNDCRDQIDGLNKKKGVLDVLAELETKNLKEERANLEEEVENLHAILNELQKTNEKLHAENLSLRRINEGKGRTSDEAPSAKEIELGFKLKQANDELTFLHKTNADLMMGNSDLRVETEDCKGQTRALLKINQDLRDQLDFYNKSDHDFAGKAKKAIEAKEMELDKLMEKYKTLFHEKMGLAEECRELSNKYIETQESLNKLQAQMQECKRANDILEEKLNHTKASENNLREQLDIYESRMKEISKKEGLILGAEERYKDMLEEVTNQMNQEIRNSKHKTNQMLEGAKLRFQETLNEKDQTISELRLELQTKGIKLGRLELEAASLKKDYEKYLPLKDLQEEKEQLIIDLNKRISQLTVENESQGRRAREAELSKMQASSAIPSKDEAYRKVEDEVNKYKIKVDTLNSEISRLTNTIKKKDRQLTNNEEDRAHTIKKSSELHSLADEDYNRRLAKKEEEICELVRQGKEKEAEAEQRMKQRDELFDQLVKQYKVAMEGYDQRIRLLSDENQEIKHKYQLLEKMIA